MYSKAALISVLAAIVEARFGQEQVPISAISAVTSGGQSGQAATLAGAAISTLLGGANACAKLQKADEILATLGEGADAVAAARGLVGAEKNFNPFATSIPSICSDATLPKNPLLRGVTPLIDPAVGGSAIANAAAKSSLTTPLAADGKSVADLLVSIGFSNFTTQDSAGTAGKAPAGGAGGAVAAPAPVAEVSSAAPAASNAAPAVADCGAATTFVTVTMGAGATAAPAPTNVAATPADASAGASPAVGVNPGQQKSSLGLDFGTCTPTMKFEAGLNGRKDTEFTFQAIDPVVNKGQQEALNPNIITNRICDQLGNVCGASAAGKAACLDAKAKILALGTRNQATADAWNTALGFAGTNTNPDNAPQAGLVGHT